MTGNFDFILHREQKKQNKGLIKKIYTMQALYFKFYSCMWGTD